MSTYRSGRIRRGFAAGIAVLTAVAAVVLPLDHAVAAERIPWENTLDVVELAPRPGVAEQIFRITLGGGPTQCAQLAEHPWWSGNECWYPDSWGGNFQVFVHPSLDGRKAQMRLGYDCWLDNALDYASPSCTVTISPAQYGYAGTTNPLYFIGSTNYRGNEYSFNGGASQIVPVDWNKLFPDSEPVNESPRASFQYSISETDPFTVEFTNTSTDAEDPLSQMSSLWDFGDSTTSTDLSPSHTFAVNGDYEVALTVTDRGGKSSTSRMTVEVDASAPLIVNSTSDRAALDPATKGCDTGELVGDDHECSLRAAIETANELGGGEITFDIDGAGVPQVALASPLPSIAAATTIDGTTQTGGLIEVSGGGDTGIELAAGPTTLTGLVINGSTVSVEITGGDGHRVADNLLGVDAAGTTADDTEVGVVVADGSGATISGNVVVAAVGIAVGPTASGVEVSGNRVGYGNDGTTVVGEPEAGVWIYGPNAVVSDNVVRAHGVGIWVATATASGTKVDGNRVGVNSTGTIVAQDLGYGIRVDGTPNVEITGNRVVSSEWATIAVAGSVQAINEEDGSITLLSPAFEETGLPVTGGGTTITGNLVGLVGSPGVPAGSASRGISSWAGASGLIIDGNTVVSDGEVFTGIDLAGGKDHLVVGNRVGAEGHPVPNGIAIDSAPASTIGGPGSAANVLTTTSTGVDVDAASLGVRVEANQIVGSSAYHVAVAVDAVGATVTDNMITGGNVGIDVSAGQTTITGNHVTDQLESGIVSTGDGTTISGNSVHDIGDGGGIIASGDVVAVDSNRVGVDTSGVVVGNQGVGIVVADGTLKLTRNLVAGSGSDGIKVGSSAVGTLRSNRVWDSEADPISVSGGPDAPTLAAAIRAGSADSPRTTLVVSGLPEGDPGTIEVFANDSCDDPEAQYLLEINRVKGADETVRIIQIIGNASRDHFTVTYTDTGGRTSELSNCEDRADHPDSDGDGSVDPIDGLLGREDDATTAVLVTDSEQLLYMSVADFDESTGVGGGHFEDLAVIDDPDPSAHEPEWTLPYGAISFRIAGLDPGGSTTVILTALSGDTPILGSSYWKYGPQTTGGPQQWYDFAYDEASGTGAQLISSVDVPGIGIRRAFALTLKDGGRGDNDGGANGTITDPGGPVVGAVPATTTVVTTTTSTTIVTTPTSAPGGTLAVTGRSMHDPARIALLLIGLGLISIGTATRRKLSRP